MDEAQDNLLNFLAATVESIRDRMTEIDTRLESGFERMDAGLAGARGDIERVHLRLDALERLLATRLDRLETEMSRLRSVVYLLVKDKPDLLRLLGEIPIA